jgi:xylulokinase
VLEGVAFALADGVDALRDAGTRIDRLAVIGGGARSRYWGRILSAAMDTSLVYLRGGEVGPALGAARLAQLAVDGGAARDVCLPPPVDRVIDPDAADIERLAPKKEAFKAAYPRITPLRRNLP